MTISLSPPAALSRTIAGGGGFVGQIEQRGDISQTDKGGGVNQGAPVGQVATSGTPSQGPVQVAPSAGSWISRNSKLVGALVGGAIGGGAGFLLAGPIGALGGAAVGALAGSVLIGRFARPSGSGPMPLPPPPPPSL